MKINSIKAISVLITAIILFTTTGCKRENVLAVTPSNPTTPAGVETQPVIPVDDLTQVVTGVSGIVLDETNAPIAGAVVTAGAASATTDGFGGFHFKDISLSKNNGSVTVTKTGYFKGVRSFKAIAGSDEMVKIQLMQKVLSGTLNSAVGGTISSNGGAMISFPANAFVTGAGTLYTGAVKIYSRWIDPSAANLIYIVPGDLRGIDSLGRETMLTTFGMIGAELEDATGNTIQLAPGKKANITVNIPASLSSYAPDSIPLWHFDNSTARWTESGKGIRSGNTYTAQVDRFSFWNYDYSLWPVRLDFTILDNATNSPLVGAIVKIHRVTAPVFYGYGISNSIGHISTLVPHNQALLLQILSPCNTVVYSQTIGPFSIDTDLGTIHVSLPTETVTFSGTVSNCTGPVSNGYVSLYAPGGYSAFTKTSASGAFSFSVLNCPANTLAYSCFAGDNSTGLQSAVITGTANNGTVNLGNIGICSGSSPAVDVYLSGYEATGANIQKAETWKNGILTNLTDGARFAYTGSVFVSGTDVYVGGSEQNLAYVAIGKVWKNGVGINVSSGNFDASVSSVFVSGADVYAAGYQYNTVGVGGGLNGIKTAKIWKNGVETALTGGTTQAEAECIVVSGTDVYVGGYEKNAGGTNIAKIWKNGVSMNINATNFSQVHSIFISGTDVYASGYEASATGIYIAKTWKNGVSTALTNGSFYAEGNCITVSGTDVYVAGYNKNSAGNGIATVWKNGVATNLTSGTYYADARSIAVAGTDIYVAGRERNAAAVFISKLWKNNSPIQFSDGTKNAALTSVVVQ